MVRAELHDALEALARAVATAMPEDLAEVVGALRELEARTWVRMTAAAAQPPELRLLTADEAASLGHMPRKRVFSLARAQSARWAVRVGRALRVDEAAFTRFLRGLDRDVPGGPETAPKGGAKRRKGGSHVDSGSPVTSAAFDRPGRLIS